MQLKLLYCTGCLLVGLFFGLGLSPIPEGTLLKINQRISFGSTSRDEAIEKLIAPGSSEEPHESRIKQLIEIAESDPKVIDLLKLRLLQETDEQKMNVVRDVLSSLKSEEITPWALTLAQSDNHRQALEGFTILNASAPSDEISNLAENRLPSAKEPALIAIILRCLQPPELSSPHHIAKMLNLIGPFAEHPDPLVRAHAIQQISSWDRQGDLAILVIKKGLSDKDSLVRKASVGGIGLAQLRSKALLSGLLTIASDEAEEHDTRVFAIEALDRFELTIDQYSQAKSTLAALQRRKH